MGQCVQTHIDLCPPPIDHFQCYETKPSTFSTAPVTVVDAFGPLTGTLRFPHRLCPPVSKNNEGILDPTDHLVGYSTRYGPFTKQLNQTLVDQFGTLQLDITRPDLARALEREGAQPPPRPFPVLQGEAVARCGCSRSARGITDQFETAVTTLTVTKPFRVCLPANKNGEDPTAPQHPDHLTCYKTKGPRFTGSTHTVTNQFETNDPLQVIHRRELCLPSLRNPGATTTTSTVVATTSTSSSTTTSSTVPSSPSPAFLDTALDLLD
jgi:hypothetical protein